ncbi:TROVE domain-containing protein [Actinomadura chibensis]|uniref:TROVE domain-containing protein n=2 Tax=Actinomadura chibensis TaxID=392828 RepID=A0A5D0NC62_9ACTN|nr:TROVE domain-containing protein [Actinomadura chibensis]
MGVMALVRNPRNFERAGVSDEVAATVTAKISDPGVIARSRMFPFRFLAAHKAAPSLQWT